MNNTKLSKLKVALVHDYLLKFGGAERVLKSLSEMFPQAPIYTLLYDEAKMGKMFGADRVKESFLGKLPKLIKSKHTLLLPWYPMAIEQMDFSGYDLVISSSNSFAHGIITNSDTVHISYCHSPTRYVWDWYNEYFDELGYGGLKSMIAKKVLHKIRNWDQVASKRVDFRLANSRNVQKRIRKYYRQDSKVIYPPVEVDRFKKSDSVDDYFLIVSALTPFKRIDLAVDFFNKIGKRLLIVGEGKAKVSLMQKAGLNIEFLGGLDDAQVADLMSKCRGLIFAGEEDFGITPVEAMASGRPVFALNKGGVTESVVDKETGIFFDEPTLESFEEGFAKFLSWEKKFFDPQKAVERAEMFSENRFKTEIFDYIQSCF